MKVRRIPESTEELAQLLKGVYEQVSRELGVEPYYVSRAARGELRSEIVEVELERELKRVLARVSENGAPTVQRNGRAGRKTSNRKERQSPRIVPA